MTFQMVDSEGANKSPSERRKTYEAQIENKCF